MEKTPEEKVEALGEVLNLIFRRLSEARGETDHIKRLATARELIEEQIEELRRAGDYTPQCEGCRDRGCDHCVE